MTVAVEAPPVDGATIVGVDIMPSEQRVRAEVQFTDMPTLPQLPGELNAGEPVPLVGTGTAPGQHCSA
ncbi:MAG: hypothetical protein Q8N44_20625 [Rubrivivax sp.]|nr:hypothetical protein [Rubrivivax sp.]MDP3086082.1 hypothetical protein [Rubrivivax sp.]